MEKEIEVAKRLTYLLNANIKNSQLLASFFVFPVVFSSLLALGGKELAQTLPVTFILSGMSLLNLIIATLLLGKEKYRYLLITYAIANFFVLAGYTFLPLSGFFFGLAVVSIYFTINYVLGFWLQAIALSLFYILWFPPFLPLKTVITGPLITFSALVFLVFLTDFIVQRAFGIRLKEAFTGFFFQWLFKKKLLEQTLEKIGKPTNLKAKVLWLKTPSFLTAIILPEFHFGPFGNLGSSRTPAFFHPYVVLHSMTTHDYDLVSETYLHDIKNKIKPPKEWKSGKFGYAKFQLGKAFADVLKIGEYSLVGFSRTPDVTEDVEISAGKILEEKLKEKLGHVLLFDEHNSSAEKITHFDINSPEFQEYLNLANIVTKPLEEDAEIGFVQGTLKSLGSAGYSAFIFKPKNIVLLVLDGNGIERNSLELLEQRLKKAGYTPIVATTDTHEVNDVSGITNDIHLTEHEIEKILLSLKKAEFGPFSYAYQEIEFTAKILGPGSAIRILTVLNDLVSVLMILLPAALIIVFIINLIIQLI